MLSPNHRFLFAEQVVEAGGPELAQHEDPLVRLLYARECGTPHVVDELARALELYERKRQSRYLLEAMLLAPDGTTEKIVENMKVRKGVVENYTKYFFDTTVFEDEFDRVDYISELTDDGERITKKMAITEGYHYLVAHFNGRDLGLSPLEVCKKMQSFAYQMVNQARGSRIGSEAAKEANKWAGIVKTFTDAIAKSDEGSQSNFVAEFSVILQNGKPFPTVDQLPPGELVQG